MPRRNAAPALPVTVRDLRRAQIVAEGRRLVAEGGLGALTIGALEERLPFSRGVITHHFRDKDEVVEAVLTSALEEIDASTASDLAASATLPDRLHAVLRTKVHGFLAHPEATRILMSFWGQLGSDRRARDRNAALFRRYRRQAARLFEGLPGVDAEAAAAVVVGQVIGIVALALFDPGAFDVDRAIARASRLT